MKDIETRFAVLSESVARIEQARALQSTEIERRLGELNHENARVKSVQNQSVTADKFEDYTKTTHAAIQAALDNLEDKHAAREETFQEKMGRVLDRLTMLEGDFRAMKDAEELRLNARSDNSDKRNAWMIAVMGVVLTIIILVVNIAFNR